MSSQNLSRLDDNARRQATVIATNKYMLMSRFFNSFDACVGPITLNPPASVHAGALATETVLSAPNCAIGPKMTSVRTQSQC